MNDEDVVLAQGPRWPMERRRGTGSRAVLLAAGFLVALGVAKHLITLRFLDLMDGSSAFPPALQALSSVLQWLGPVVIISLWLYRAQSVNTLAIDNRTDGPNRFQDRLATFVLQGWVPLLLWWLFSMAMNWASEVWLAADYKTLPAIAIWFNRLGVHALEYDLPGLALKAVWLIAILIAGGKRWMAWGLLGAWSLGSLVVALSAIYWPELLQPSWDQQHSSITNIWSLLASGTVMVLLLHSLSRRRLKPAVFLWTLLASSLLMLEVVRFEPAKPPWTSILQGAHYISSAWWHPAEHLRFVSEWLSASIAQGPMLAIALTFAQIAYRWLWVTTIFSLVSIFGPKDGKLQLPENAHSTAT